MVHTERVIATTAIIGGTLVDIGTYRSGALLVCTQYSVFAAAATIVGETLIRIDTITFGTRLKALKTSADALFAVTIVTAIHECTG